MCNYGQNLLTLLTFCFARTIIKVFYLKANQTNSIPSNYPPHGNHLHSNPVNPSIFYQNTSMNHTLQHNQYMQPNPMNMTNQMLPNNSQQQYYNRNYPAPMYIYMSPPISPLPNLFLQNPTNGLVQFSTCILIIKNAPYKVSISEIISFLSGYGEVSHL